MFDLKNYERAKEIYRDQYKKDLTNKKLKYRFGTCLVYTYEVADAIKILESVASDPSTPIEVSFHLARAYHLSNRYDKAIALYKKYIATTGAKAEEIDISNRNIEMCNNAKALIKSHLILNLKTSVKTLILLVENTYQ